LKVLPARARYFVLPGFAKRRVVAKEVRRVVHHVPAFFQRLAAIEHLQVRERVALGGDAPPDLIQGRRALIWAKLAPGLASKSVLRNRNCVVHVFG